MHLLIKKCDYILIHTHRSILVNVHKCMCLCVYKNIEMYLIAWNIAPHFSNQFSVDDFGISGGLDSTYNRTTSLVA